MTAFIFFVQLKAGGVGGAQWFEEEGGWPEPGSWRMGQAGSDRLQSMFEWTLESLRLPASISKTLSSPGVGQG